MGFTIFLGVMVIILAYSLTWFLYAKSQKIIVHLDKEKLMDIEDTKDSTDQSEEGDA